MNDSEDRIQELEALLRIDQHALDDALLEQPETFYRVAKKLALDISRRDEAKINLAEAEATADMKFRRDAEVADEKITEPQVKMHVRQEKGVKKARDNLMQLERSVSRWSALKEAFIQRSHALKHLTELYQANYFADATGSSQRSSMKDMRADRVRAAQTEMRRRT